MAEDQEGPRPVTPKSRKNQQRIKRQLESIQRLAAQPAPQDQNNQADDEEPGR